MITIRLTGGGFEIEFARDNIQGVEIVYFDFGRFANMMRFIEKKLRDETT